MSALADLVNVLVQGYFEIVGATLTIYFTYRGVKSLIETKKSR